MTLQQLRYAIVISETGSMNKAAETLYIAQPSLTGAMQELERELGITIFHRSGRGVTLTNDGRSSSTMPVRSTTSMRRWRKNTRTRTS